MIDWRRRLWRITTATIRSCFRSTAIAAAILLLLLPRASNDNARGIITAHLNSDLAIPERMAPWPDLTLNASTHLTKTAAVLSSAAPMTHVGQVSLETNIAIEWRSDDPVMMMIAVMIDTDAMTIVVMITAGTTGAMTIVGMTAGMIAGMIVATTAVNGIGNVIVTITVTETVTETTITTGIVTTIALSEIATTRTGLWMSVEKRHSDGWTSCGALAMTKTSGPWITMR